MQIDASSDIESLTGKIKAGEKEIESLKAAVQEAKAKIRGWNDK
jgi:peptidoglycan hydrolase CwlO-like protein